MNAFIHVQFLRKALSVFTVFLICLPYVTHADAPRDMQVSPAVIDEKAKQRDIIKESITLTNTGSKPLNLFPAVEDVNIQNGDQTFAYAQNADARSDSLANWIQLSRGVIELNPGETKTIPFVIQVNSNAVPGTYHVAITFTDGGTRDEVQNKNPNGVAQVNVEIKADIKEDLQLLKFSTDRIVFNGDDVLFDYQIVNNGNQQLAPSGDIRIYDRRGKEVANVDVNKEGKSISPEQTTQLASVWSAVSGFGQFKAIITVNYGKTQTASVQDTVFFWIVPWKQLLGLFTIIVVVMLVLGLYFHRWFEERHLNKLAMAGLLKTHPITAQAVSSAAAYMPNFPLVPPPRPKRAPPPPREEIYREPKDRIVVRVAENIVIAWRLFTTFKRSGRLTPEDITQKKEVSLLRRFESSTKPALTQITTHEPQVQLHTALEQPTRNDEPSRTRYLPAPPVHGGTIDLKSSRAKAKEELYEGHVVNLKKQS